MGAIGSPPNPYKNWSAMIIIGRLRTCAKTKTWMSSKLSNAPISVSSVIFSFEPSGAGDSLWSSLSFLTFPSCSAFGGSTTSSASFAVAESCVSSFSFSAIEAKVGAVSPPFLHSVAAFCSWSSRRCVEAMRNTSCHSSSHSCSE